VADSVRGIADSRRCRYTNFLQAVLGLRQGYLDGGVAIDDNVGAYTILANLAVASVACTQTAPGACSYTDAAREEAARMLAAGGGGPAFLHYALHAHDFPYEAVYGAGLTFAIDYPMAVNQTSAPRLRGTALCPVCDRLPMATQTRERLHGAVAQPQLERSPFLPHGLSAQTPFFVFRLSTEATAQSFHPAAHRCHSLHMPSHLWDRDGNFSLGCLSNLKSVSGADAFSSTTFGALASVGGDVGEGGWQPTNRTWVSGLGFAFDAGNVYHSLEYMQYEALQLCQLSEASRLLSRMSVATHQAVHAGGADSFGEPAAYGAGKYAASSFYMWLYRMEGRQALQAAIFSLLGGVGAAAEQMATRAELPLPLPWEGYTMTDHSFYAPQSEAGIWTSVALSHALHVSAVGAAPVPISTAPVDAGALYEAACGGAYGSSLSCADAIVHVALKRLRAVQAHYATSNATQYEASLTASLVAQVASAAALAGGELRVAMEQAEAAAAAERAAPALLLPISTSVFFVPGTAFHGAMALRVHALQQAAAATASPSGRTQPALLAAAAASFDDCLAPAGRPNLPPCLLGAARAARALGNDSAAGHYQRLLQVWTDAPPACGTARAEAEAYADGGAAPPPPPADAPGASVPVSVFAAVVVAAAVFGVGTGVALGRASAGHRTTAIASAGPSGCGAAESGSSMQTALVEPSGKQI